MSDRPRGSVRYQNAGRVALVTGGASGIGEAICAALADSDAEVVCVDVNETSDRRVRQYSCDTSDEQQCRAAVEWAVEQFGGVDILVNNAAIQPKESYHPIDEIDGEVWERMLAVNFSGYTWMARHTLRQMKKQQSGVIVNMASGQAHRTAREVGVYGPIKAGNVMQTRQWGVEYAREGIRVVSVSPGAIDTPLVRATLEAQGGGEALANRHPLGRIGRPEEVAAAVLWLCSDEASFVTATDLEVDGGLGAFGAFADPYPR
ncbi:MAG: SDR family oxidoreductase [Planctomycetota bacterium]